MAKRNSDEWSSKRVEVISEQIEADEPAQTVRLRLLKDVILNITGAVTGAIYHFHRAGSEVDIDYDDAQLFLQKTFGGDCECPGNPGPQRYFELVN